MPDLWCGDEPGHPDCNCERHRSRPEGQWTWRRTKWANFIEHPDGTRLQPMSSRIGETSEDVVVRIVSALNTADAEA